MSERQMRSILIKAAFWLMTAAAAWVVWRYLIGALLPFVAGFFIAYLLRPAASFIRRHSGMGERGAAIVPAVLFYALLTVTAWLLCVWLLGEADDLGTKLPALFENTVQPFLSEIGNRLEQAAGHISSRAGSGIGNAVDMAAEAFTEAAASISRWGIGLLSGMAKKLPMMVATLVATIFSSVLICVEYDKVVGFVIRLIPHKYREAVFELRDFLLRTLGKTLRAYLILMVITFAEVASGLCLLRAGRVLPMAALTAFLDLLPVLGSGIVLVPWGIWGFLSGDPLLGWGLLALWVVISVAREFIEPRIVGGQIGLHPLAAILSMYAGLRLIGISGLILAPILCMTLLHLRERQG